MISAQVFSEITSESLTEVEKAALQLCAARKDADLQAVLEVYRLEGDKDDLLDSVKRIARKTIDETVAAGLPGGGDAAAGFPERPPAPLRVVNRVRFLF